MISPSLFSDKEILSIGRNCECLMDYSIEMTINEAELHGEAHFYLYIHVDLYIAAIATSLTVWQLPLPPALYSKIKKTLMQYLWKYHPKTTFGINH